jgi:hypothetical protein
MHPGNFIGTPLYNQINKIISEENNGRTHL